MKKIIRLLKRTPLLNRFIPSNNQQTVPQGPDGIKAIGHRQYVGGLWDQMGRLQFDYLVKKGLEPQHFFLDIACGSLRAGVHFIPFLEKGHYLGMDKESGLIEKGVREELTPELVKIKDPQLVVSDKFHFEKFSSPPDFALAQSLFTHLPPRIINLCFRNLRDVAHPNTVFYATFFETEDQSTNPEEPHDHANFKYTRQEMENFGTDNGWAAQFIGDWDHPRNQVIVEYRPS
jgi:hypothetical protein